MKHVIMHVFTSTIHMMIIKEPPRRKRKKMKVKVSFLQTQEKISPVRHKYSCRLRNNTETLCILSTSKVECKMSHTQTEDVRTNKSKFCPMRIFFSS